MFQISPQTTQPPSRAYRLQSVSLPTVEPVTASDYMSYQRIKTADIDPIVIADKLTAARERVEQYIKRGLVNQTWDLFIDIPPGTGSDSYWSWERFLGYLTEVPITFPKSPLISVVGAYVYDDTDTQITVDPGSYWVSRAKDPARLALRNAFTWPDTGNRSFETFRVRFAVGYLSPFSVDGSTANITVVNHGRVVGDIVRVTNRDGALPAPLQDRTDYFVVQVVDANTLHLSATATGSAITCSDVGSGVQFLGVLPSQIRRAILITAAADRYGAGSEEKRKTGGGGSKQNPNAERHGESGLPADAETELQGIRSRRII